MIPLPSSFLTTPLAHRALHDVSVGRPENSIPAIEAAIEAGYGLELDLQLSSDGQAMVFHDYDLKRQTGLSGPIQVRSSAELSVTKLLGGDTTIPTLSEVLEYVDGRAPVLLELKDQDGAMGKNVGVLEDAVATAIENYQGPLAVMSFNPHSTTLMSHMSPTVPRGITTGAFTAEDWQLLPLSVREHLREIPDYESSQASFISHRVEDLGRDSVTKVRAKGGAVLCWLVKSAASEKIARNIADNITFEGYLPEIPQP